LLGEKNALQSALVFLFLVTWNENTISSGVLVLIGISFGTTLMAATADQSSPTPADVTLAEKMQRTRLQPHERLLTKLSPLSS